MQNAPSITLEGKSIVVIGGTSGIGLSACQAMISAGARIVAVGLDQESVAAATSMLGSNARVLKGDATQSGAALEAVAQAVALHGKLDGLYHVAGGSGRRWGDGPLHELSDEAWHRTLELNLSSVMFSNRAAVNQFLAQNSAGAILNLSSVLAFSPAPTYFATHAYAVSKAALIGLTQTCSAFYAKKQIRFNAIASGLMATPMSRRAQASAEIRGYLRGKQPLAPGGIGQAADLDGAAVYLLSDAAALVTGQVLAVDGGWSVSEP